LKKLLIIFLIPVVAMKFSFASWESDFPKHVNEFIFKTTHSKCLYSDYIDGILSEDIIHSSTQTSYIASFSVYGEPENGLIEVAENARKELFLVNIDCPRLY
jgi:hypothetical protein